MKKIFHHSLRLDHQQPADRERLLERDTSGPIASADDSAEDDDNVGDDEEMEERDTNGTSDECAHCQQQRHALSADCGNRVCASTADVIEVCVVEEEEDEENKKNKKKKKTWKKRVRKRVWRVMRCSWKYLRRGMSGYSPGLASLFTWGVNFNQAMSAARRPEKTRYF